MKTYLKINLPLTRAASGQHSLRRGVSVVSLGCATYARPRARRTPVSVHQATLKQASPNTSHVNVPFRAERQA